jgi:hypothetical protein
MFTSSNNIVIQFWDVTYENLHRAENKEALESAWKLLQYCQLPCKISRDISSDI